MSAGQQPEMGLGASLLLVQGPFWVQCERQRRQGRNWEDRQVKVYENK